VTRTITLEDRHNYLTYRCAGGGAVELFEIEVGTTRRTGQGRRLVEAMLMELRTRNKTARANRFTHYTLCEVHIVYVLTRRDNNIARQFYSALGFTIAADMPDFYGPNEGAIIYRRGVEP
jgi:ribosomal protein S18 acetylase RimI-like enzyme